LFQNKSSINSLKLTWFKICGLTKDAIKIFALSQEENVPASLQYPSNFIAFNLPRFKYQLLTSVISNSPLWLGFKVLMKSKALFR
jgi:hypothetical protein